MHDVAVLWVAAQDVGDNLAEGLRIESFVDILYGGVYILLSGRNATLHVTVVHNA